MKNFFSKVLNNDPLSNPSKSNTKNSQSGSGVINNPLTNKDTSKQIQMDVQGKISDSNMKNFTVKHGNNIYNLSIENNNVAFTIKLEQIGGIVFCYYKNEFPLSTVINKMNIVGNNMNIFDQVSKVIEECINTKKIELVYQTERKIMLIQLQKGSLIADFELNEVANLGSNFQTMFLGLFEEIKTLKNKVFLLTKASQTNTNANNNSISKEEIEKLIQEKIPKVDNKQSNNNYDEQLKDINNNLQKVNKEIEKDKNDINNLKEENVKLSNEKNVIDDIKNKLNEEINSLKNEIQNLSKNTQNKGGEDEGKLNDNFANLEKELSELKNNLNKFNEEATNSKKEINDLKEENNKNNEEKNKMIKEIH